jgi:hypothetical protein
MGGAGPPSEVQAFTGLGPSDRIGTAPVDKRSEWVHGVDMGSGPNPSIWGEVVRRELTSEERGAANREDVREEQAALNAADLRDLEAAEYYGEPSVIAPKPTMTAAEPTPAEPHRSIIDRLLRRGSR